MIAIFHGEHIVASRNALMERLTVLKNRNVRIETRSIESLSLNEAETLLGTSSLFQDETCIVLEGVLSGVASSFKKKIIALSLDSSVTVLFWESKDLSATALKQFPDTVEKLAFPLSKKIWSWLDSVRPGNAQQSVRLLSEAEQQDGIEFCFIMLISHVRKMLLVKDGCPPKQAPFAAKKLQAQTETFTWEKLLAIQAWLLKTDVAMKSGANAMSLRAELDLLLFSI